MAIAQEARVRFLQRRMEQLEISDDEIDELRRCESRTRRSSLRPGFSLSSFFFEIPA